MPWMVAPSTTPVGSTRIIGRSTKHDAWPGRQFEVATTKAGAGPYIARHQSPSGRVLSVHICGYLCASVFLFAVATPAKPGGRPCDGSVQKGRNTDTHRYPQINTDRTL